MSIIMIEVKYKTETNDCKVINQNDLLLNESYWDSCNLKGDKQYSQVYRQIVTFVTLKFRFSFEKQIEDDR
jgi:hypothetical protein